MEHVDYSKSNVKCRSSNEIQNSNVHNDSLIFRHLSLIWHLPACPAYRRQAQAGILTFELKGVSNVG